MILKAPSVKKYVHIPHYQNQTSKKGIRRTVITVEVMKVIINAQIMLIQTSMEALSL